MVKSVFTKSYEQLCQLLINARQNRDLTQADIAEKLQRPQSFVSKYERGERRLDLIEFLQIAAVLDVAPVSIIEKLEGYQENILDKWEITPYELTQLLAQNPSLRGMLFGYVAEFKLEQLHLQGSEISKVYKHDDHDRRGKGDRVVVYKNHEFIIEAKSLQTNTITRQKDKWIAKSQVDASDRRTITLPNGFQVTTTCLLVGEFDVLAVNTYPFEEEWNFVFAKNSDLPRSSYRQYTPEQRKYLLATTVRVTWPTEPPFSTSLYQVLDELIAARAQDSVSSNASDNLSSSAQLNLEL